jgi:TetR/AcrR family transcriptional repressor of nem operon
VGRTSDARENLIHSAIELIGNRSYNAVGVQELCEHAGVKKGSFYHFFPSKRHLTLEAIDTIWQVYKGEMLEPICCARVPALKKLESMLRRSYEFQSKSKECGGCMTGCGFGNLALELSTQDEVIRQKIADIFEDWAMSLERVIAQAVGEGDLPADTDTRATSRAIIAYFEGVYVLAKAFNDPGMIPRLGEGVFSICIKRTEEAAAAAADA